MNRAGAFVPAGQKVRRYVNTARIAQPLSYAFAFVAAAFRPAAFAFV
jgi:hypothetical protein